MNRMVDVYSSYSFEWVIHLRTFKMGQKSQNKNQKM